MECYYKGIPFFPFVSVRWYYIVFAECKFSLDNLTVKPKYLFTKKNNFIFEAIYETVL